MVSEFAEAAYTLEEVGDVYPEPVRTEYGFHAIKFTQTLQPMPMEQAQRRLKNESKREAVRSEVERLLSSVTVRINSDGIPVSLEAAEQPLQNNRYRVGVAESELQNRAAGFGS